MKHLLWTFLAIFFGLYICQSVADPDLWWHITVGRWILAHGQVPHVDLWNMFSNGELWRAYSWSVEMLFAFVERLGGGRGLMALQVVFACAISFAFFSVFGKIARDHFVGALLGGYTTVACFNHFTLRPQSLVWVLFALSIVVADGISERGASRPRLLALAALGSLWSNIHLTAVLGLGTVFLWTVQDAAHRFAFRRAFLASAAFFVGTLVTPYVGGEWLTFIAKGGHPLQYSSISEFQPATILQYSTVFVVLMGAILIAAFQSERAAPPPGRLVLGAGMTLAGLTALKFLPFSAIVLGALCAAWWRQSGHIPQPKGTDHLAEGVRQLRKGFFSLEHATLVAGGVLLLGMIFSEAASLYRGPAVSVDAIPEEAVDFIEAKKLGFPVLNEFTSGGYLMYRFSDPATGEPLHKVPIDGRTNVNSPEIWELYRASFLGKANWDGYIKKVGPGTIVWRYGSAMSTLLDESPEWCRVYASGNEDDSFVVFIKRAEFDSRRPEFTSPDCT
jgi:hypothetical protein